MINISKVCPLKKTGDSWNYENWIAGIDVLYGEGHSKYKDNEIEDIEKLRDLISKFLMFKKPHNMIVDNGMGSSKINYALNVEVWIDLKKLIEIFEQRVKYYNDQHGLSTKNYEEDWEGL